MSNNALHTAAKAGNVAEMQAQIGKFDINAKGQFDMTALNWAAHDGQTEVVKLLLTLKPAPDVNMPNVSIQTVISVHLICIFFISHISILVLYPLSYPSRHVLLSRVVDVPPSPSTTQHDILALVVILPLPPIIHVPPSSFLPLPHALSISHQPCILSYVLLLLLLLAVPYRMMVTHHYGIRQIMVTPRSSRPCYWLLTSTLIKPM